MTEKSAFTYENNPTVEWIAKNQIVATSAILYISLHMNKKMVAENQKLRLCLLSDSSKAKRLAEKDLEIFGRLPGNHGNSLEIASKAFSFSFLCKNF